MSLSKIYFEKQVARFCAQHAINMLLQGEYSAESELRTIADELDAAEWRVLGPAAKPKKSNNMDSTGFFSVQVIMEALKRGFGLDLINIERADLAHLKLDPSQGDAYICNMQLHWFAVRKLGNQWFELNSCKLCPELLGDVHLAAYFSALSHEGYSIFAVEGILPETPIHDILRANPVTKAEIEAKKVEITGLKEKTSSSQADDDKSTNRVRRVFEGVGRRLGEVVDKAADFVLGPDAPTSSAALDEETQLAIAKAMSTDPDGNEFDAEMARAIEESLKTQQQPQNGVPNAEELRRLRARHMDKMEQQWKTKGAETECQDRKNDK